MKRLKDINLESSYMNPAKVRFYTSEWSPNGTSPLYVCDDMDQVVEIIECALFGPILDVNSCGDMFGAIHVDYYGESISVVEAENLDPDLTTSDIEQVYPLRIDQVLDSIAESPVQSRISVLRKLIKAIKEAA